MNDRARIRLIGAPSQAGTHRPGTAMGPAMLRTAGLGPALSALGASVEDAGDAFTQEAPDVSQAPRPHVLRNVATVAANATAVAAATESCLADAVFPVILGGDHSVSIGSLDGVARHCRRTARRIFVLWLDAHADVNTAATTPSGNMHGMALSAACGEPTLSTVFSGRRTPGIPPADVSLFGLRSVDPGERTWIREHGVDAVDMRQIDEHGVVKPLRRILERVKAADGHLHVSFDVDFLDPDVAPGAGTVVPGGASYREAHLAMEMIHESGLAGSLDVVELNPYLDERGRTARAMVELVASLFGSTVIDRA